MKPLHVCLCPWQSACMTEHACTLIWEGRGERIGDVGSVEADMMYKSETEHTAFWKALVSRFWKTFNDEKSKLAYLFSIFLLSNLILLVVLFLFAGQSLPGLWTSVICYQTRPCQDLVRPTGHGPFGTCAYLHWAPCPPSSPTAAKAQQLSAEQCTEQQCADSCPDPQAQLLFSTNMYK